MSQIRIPSFLTKLDKEEKQEMMKEYMQWKLQFCTEYLAKYLEDELERLVLEDEKRDYTTWFQTKWSKAKALGKREVLRHIIKDLT